MACARTLLSTSVCVCILYTVAARTADSLFEEPVCSKFHFEEHVLDKLVRLQVNIEQFLKNVNEELSGFKDEISDLKQEVASMKTTQDKDRAEFTTVTKGLQNQLQSFDSEIKTFYRDVETKITDLVSQDGTAKSVAFVARNPPKSLPDSSTIVFLTTVLNAGDAYDPLTGKFTAPVSGTYLFSVQLCPDNNAHSQLIVNDNVLGVAYHYDNDKDGVCASMVTVATMKSGEQAWVRNAHSGVKVSADSINERWNMFTGVLVNPTGD